MTKDDVQDQIFRAAAVYLLVLAVIALPNGVSSALALAFLAEEAIRGAMFEDSITGTLTTTAIASAVGATFKVIFYIVVARNLYNGASWFRRLLGIWGREQNNPLQGTAESRKDVAPLSHEGDVRLTR